MRNGSTWGKMFVKAGCLFILAAGSMLAAGGGGGTTSCSWIQSMTVKAGYPPKGLNVWGTAIWTTVNAQSCNTALTTIVRLTVTNLDDATVSPQVLSYYLTPKFAYTIDDEVLPFSTNYKLELAIVDLNGNVLDSKSALASTPGPKVVTTP